MKTIITLVGIALIFSLSFTITYGIRKSWVWHRFIFVFFFIGFMQMFSVLSPIAWFALKTKKYIITYPLYWLLWFVLDDSRIDKSTESGYANDYWVYIQDRGETKETFKIFLKWHFKRNRVWNFLELFKIPQASFKTGNQKITNVEFIKDNLYKNDDDSTKVKQDGIYVASAGLKYIPKRVGDNIWQINVGDFISIKTSILGFGFIYYEIIYLKNGKEKTWYGFRYSRCEYIEFRWIRFKRKLAFIELYTWKGYRTLKLGTNSVRYYLSLKYQISKEWQ